METNEDRFSIFKHEGERIINLLGLKDYEITFKREEKDTARIAYVNWIPGEHCFTISFCENFAGEITTEEIEKAAIEEVLHVLFARFWELAKARTYSEEEVEYEEHRIIYRLINSGAFSCTI